VCPPTHEATRAQGPSRDACVVRRRDAVRHSTPVPADDRDHSSSVLTAVPSTATRVGVAVTGTPCVLVGSRGLRSRERRRAGDAIGYPRHLRPDQLTGLPSPTGPGVPSSTPMAPFEYSESYAFVPWFHGTKALPKSQILRVTEKAIRPARRAVSRYSSKRSKRRDTPPRHVVPPCLKVRKNTTCRGLLDELIEMPRVRRVLGRAERPVARHSVRRSTGSIWLCGGDVDSLSDPTSDKRSCWNRCVRICPQPRFETLHETSRTHDSATQGDVAIVAFGSFYSIGFMNRCRRERRVRVAGARRKDLQTLL
jgi:hypothetical protein